MKKNENTYEGDCREKRLCMIKKKFFMLIVNNYYLYILRNMSIIPEISKKYEFRCIYFLNVITLPCYAQTLLFSKDCAHFTDNWFAGNCNTGNYSDLPTPYQVHSLPLTIKQPFYTYCRKNPIPSSNYTLRLTHSYILFNLFSPNIISATQKESLYSISSSLLNPYLST